MSLVNFPKLPIFPISSFLHTYIIEQAKGGFRKLEGTIKRGPVRYLKGCGEETWGSLLTRNFDRKSSIQT